MACLIRFTHNDLLTFRREARKLKYPNISVLQKRWKSRNIANTMFPKLVNPKNYIYWKIIDFIESAIDAELSNESESENNLKVKNEE